MEKAIAIYRRKHLVPKGNKGVSVNGVEYRLGKFFAPDLRRPLSALTEERCQILYRGKWDGERLVEPGLMQRLTKTGKPMAVDSHRSCLADAKTFLGWCVDDGIIGSNPLAKVKGQGKRRHGGKGRTDLGTKELRAFYRKALELAETDGNDDERERATGALTALLTAMRASEIVSRRVRHLDDEEWTLRVDFASAKTEESIRMFDVAQVLRPLLMRLVKGKGPEQFIFGDGDRPHWRDWVRKSVRMVCTKAKVRYATAHAMRGAHTDIAREGGATGDLVAKQLGHTDSSITERSYTSRRSAARSKQALGLEVLEGGRKEEAS